jgi:hypothetical protein
MEVCSVVPNTNLEKERSVDHALDALGNVR